MNKQKEIWVSSYLLSSYPSLEVAIYTSAVQGRAHPEPQKINILLCPLPQIDKIKCYKGPVLQKDEGA